MRGSLNQEERKLTTAEQCKIAVVHMEAALLVKTHFERADLFAAHLKGSHMREAHLEYIDIRRAQLEGAELENVSLSDEKHIGPRVVDANWSNVNLSVIKWSQVSMLGDEYQARQKKPYSKGTDSDLRLNEYEQAARANHQLAVVLEAQGLNEIAARFAYRAQVLQKSVFGLQMLQRGVTIRQRIQAFGVWLFSWFLYLLAGFGYRPGRTFISYLIVIGFFAAAYYNLSAHLAWNEAIVISMTAFHGRGFFPDQFKPGDPQALIAAIEAFVGLLIEVTFIATLTQRLFRK
jgi:hypothetical protein